MNTGTYDLLISGGRVIDGTGAPARKADVALNGDRIAAIGDLQGATAKQRVDAAGKTIAPGFIDVHTHDDNALLRTPDMTMKVSQGVTTVVVGNCGVSLAPLTPRGRTAAAARSARRQGRVPLRDVRRLHAHAR